MTGLDKLKQYAMESLDFHNEIMTGKVNPTATHNGILVHMHTGCPCYYCRKGRNKQVRREFHRRLRHKQKQELRHHGDIINTNLSIGYTD